MDVCIDMENCAKTTTSGLTGLSGDFISVIRWALWLAVTLLAASHADAQQVTLSVSSGSATPGSTVALTVSMAATGGALPSSLQWTMNYSAADVTSVSVVA